MRSRKNQAALVVVVAILAAMFLAGVFVTDRGTIAQTETALDGVSAGPDETVDASSGEASAEATDGSSTAGAPEAGQETSVADTPVTDADLANIDAIDAIHSQVKSGDLYGAGVALLDILHDLPDKAESVDDALTPTHLLTFTMCSLMDDDLLLSFLKEAFDPEKYPIDDVALTCFYMEWREYEVGRKMAFVSQDEVRKRIEGFVESASPLVRMSGLGLRTLVDWDTSTMELMVQTVDALNEMAEECPECRLTRETFRELLLAGCGKGFTNPEFVDSLAHTTLWNASMARLVADDPVVQFLEGLLPAEDSSLAKAAIAHDTAVQAALDSCDSNADPEIRDWLVRAFGPAVRRSSTDADRKSEVRAILTQLIETQDESAGPSGVMTLDVARAEYVLFAEGMDEVTPEEAPVLIEKLLCQKRDLEPISTNLFERIPMRINVYAHKQINQGNYAGAAAVFRRLTEAYPDSHLARRSQDTIDVLHGLY